MNSMYEVKCDQRPHVAKCMHKFTDPQRTIHRTHTIQLLQNAWLNLASMYISSIKVYQGEGGCMRREAGGGGQEEAEGKRKTAR